MEPGYWDDLVVLNQVGSCLRERLMQLCAVGSTLCLPWACPSEECPIYVPLDVGLKCEFLLLLASRRREIYA